MACVEAERADWDLFSATHADAGPVGALNGDRREVVLMLQELGAALGRERSMVVGLSRDGRGQEGESVMQGSVSQLYVAIDQQLALIRK